MIKHPQVTKECQELIHKLLTEVDADIIQDIRIKMPSYRETLLAELDVLEKVRCRLLGRLGTD
jgi:hypothetical protein